jgi:phenylalanyl-tRNA synthetase beta chain
MKISEQWLREWVNPEVDTDGLSEQLTMAGLEVDGIEPVAPPLANVLVGSVLEKIKHPGADKLSLCRVDIGADEPLAIVCGARNVEAGGVYPVATIGAVLPGNFKIKRSKIRGEESFGMLCSGVELGIADDADGLLELDRSLEPGMAIVDALNLDDYIIDLDLTPNRADCFSVVGAARDVAAVNALPFDEPDVAAVKPVCADTVQISLAAGSACPAFAGRVVRNIDAAAETPMWMAEKLRRSGIRPLSPVVDVTNFVMLELGQPMHAYDLGSLSGSVSARFANAGEQLTLLDDKEITLTDDVLVIADDAQVIALAGIMGGAATAVSDQTTDVFLESAFFSPAVMAGKARRFGLHTDASLRFERGVDFAGQARAIERATELLLQIVGGEPGPLTDVRNLDDLPQRAIVTLRQTRLQRSLGIALPVEDVTRMLASLGCDVRPTDDSWNVVPPSWRFDIEIEEDLIEEVARLYGYDNIPEIPQQAATKLTRVTETRVPVERARSLLVDRGYQEAINYSFVGPELQTELLGAAEELTLANPISVEQSVMRRSLWLGLLQSVAVNQKRQQTRVRMFETGAVFAREAGSVVETAMLAGVSWGPQLPEHWDAKAVGTDLFDLKADIESLASMTGRGAQWSYIDAEHPALRPGRTAQISCAGELLGWFGELHPRIAKQLGLQPAPLLFELGIESALAAEIPAYKKISKFPSVRRDLAVLVDEKVAADMLLAAARDAAGDLLRDIMVFDIYTGKGVETSLKSVALGLILQETSRTLTELEIDGVVTAVVERLSSQFNATIRE